MEINLNCMPELPEVETIRRDLQRKIIDLPISQIIVKKEKIVRSPLASLKQNLVGNQFSKIERRGKLLIFHLRQKNIFLLIHLKMTGQLIFKTKNLIIAGGHSIPPNLETIPNKHTHVIIHFADRSQLFFNDLRQFGYLQLTTPKELGKILMTYGIEPLTQDFTLSSFRQVFRRKTTKIKNILLNQKIIAGIGNIYADEICFAAKIDPRTPANQLSPAQIKALYQSTQKIIQTAIDFRGTTTNNYRDGSGLKGNYSQFLQVYGRAKQKCLRCHQSKIQKIKLAGRGTHFCPHCQNNLQKT